MDCCGCVAGAAKRIRTAAAASKKPIAAMKEGILRNMRIRRARKTDSARIAELSTQLGYPATGQEIVRRMKRMRPTALHAVFVAESEKLVVGWLHASVTPLLEVPLRAEVNGLVV